MLVISRIGFCLLRAVLKRAPIRLVGLHLQICHTNLTIYTTMLSDKFLFSFAINIFHLHSNSVISGAGDILTSEHIIESFQVTSVVPTVASCVPMVRMSAATTRGRRRLTAAAWWPPSSRPGWSCPATRSSATLTMFGWTGGRSASEEIDKSL